MGVVTSQRVMGHKETLEVHYYPSGLPVDVR